MRKSIIDKCLFLLESVLSMLAARYLLGVGDVEADVLYCCDLLSSVVRRVQHVTRWYTGWEYVHQVRGITLLRGMGYA